jgi:hypothetical protein
MDESSTLFHDAKIRLFANKLVYYNKKERPTNIYQVITKEGSFLFECWFDWMPNKRDYAVEIHNFGLRNVVDTGSSGGYFKRHFSQEEIASAKLLIENYFSRKAEITDFPLSDPRARCLLVRYPGDWIVERKT